VTEILTVSQARTGSGLRLVTVPGIPSPWSEAAKGILQVKKLPFARGAMQPGGENADLVEWTGQNSAPVLAWEDERPRTGWVEILLLAERLAPEPRLIPAAPEERALLFGLGHELMGEQGFGWCRRSAGIHAAVTAGGGQAQWALAFGRKYGYREEEGELYRRRTREILELLSAQLRRQQAAGSAFLLGDSLSALDLYWAAMAALVEPLSEEQCPMPPAMRVFYGLSDAELRPEGTDSLLAHRDRIYRDHLELPVKL
jgi:glutathione S-transferase